MKIRWKPAVISIGALLLGALVLSGFHPDLPYAFFDKYQVLDYRASGDKLAVTLAADVHEVLADAQQEVPPSLLVFIYKTPMDSIPSQFSFYGYVVVTDNTTTEPSQPASYQDGQCVVWVDRPPNLADRIKRWYMKATAPRHPSMQPILDR